MEGRRMGGMCEVRRVCKRDLIGCLTCKSTNERHLRPQTFPNLKHQYIERMCGHCFGELMKCYGPKCMSAVLLPNYFPPHRIVAR